MEPEWSNWLQIGKLHEGWKIQPGIDQFDRTFWGSLWLKKGCFDDDDYFAVPICHWICNVSVGIVTRQHTGRSRNWVSILGSLLFFIYSRQFLRPSSSPMKLLPGALSPGTNRTERKADYSPHHPVPKLRMHVFMAWCYIKHRDNSTYIVRFALCYRNSRSVFLTLDRIWGRGAGADCAGGRNLDVCVCGVSLARWWWGATVFGVFVRNREVVMVTEMLCCSLKTGKGLLLRSLEGFTTAGKISHNWRVTEGSHTAFLV
jgi:hypothetical protein